MAASYRDAIAWVAENDGLGDKEWLDLEHVSNMVTVCLLADLFKKDGLEVAKSVVRYRVKYLQK